MCWIQIYYLSYLISEQYMNIIKRKYATPRSVENTRTDGFRAGIFTRIQGSPVQSLMIKEHGTFKAIYYRKAHLVRSLPAKEGKEAFILSPISFGVVFFVKVISFTRPPLTSLSQYGLLGTACVRLSKKIKVLENARLLWLISLRQTEKTLTQICQTMALLEFHPKAMRLVG